MAFKADNEAVLVRVEIVRCTGRDMWPSLRSQQVYANHRILHNPTAKEFRLTVAIARPI